MDDTLYPLSSGLNLACRRNIEEFMLKYLHIEESELPMMCLELYREFGTTMAGLKALGYEFCNDEFHTYVHGRLPYDTLKPDPVLRNLLMSMPQRKIIFTNAEKTHATRVLNRLGVEDCFEGTICFETLNPPHEPIDCMASQEVEDCLEGIINFETLNPPHEPLDCNCMASQEGHPTGLPLPDTTCYSKGKIFCKPSLEAIKAAIRIAHVDPKKTIFFDDSARNIASGKAAGLHTVIVGSSVLVPGADHALRSIHNIREALPEIWENEGEDGKQLEQAIQSTLVETVVVLA